MIAHWKNHAFLLATLCLMITKFGHAQISGPAAPELETYNHVISFGGSYGIILNRNADFWGLSAAYSYQLKGPFALTATMAYDKETDRTIDQHDITNTFTAIATISYYFNQRISLTTGLAKGVFDDDNPMNELKAANGDWATGIALGYNLPDFPFWTRESFGVSASIEYNITKAEFMFSMDLAIGLAF